jgi:eukaryotic-like serine/threonine-protein kinase
MGTDSAPARPGELEELIEAFETAQVRHGRADLAQYLPAPDHPLYLRLLGELTRIDLEYHWQRGTPRRPEDYRLLFPRLFEDRETLRALAYEEYRLRRQAGEEPSPAEYQQRFGLTIGFWPRPTGRSGTPAAPARS